MSFGLKTVCKSRGVHELCLLLLTVIIGNCGSKGDVDRGAKGVSYGRFCSGTRTRSRVYLKVWYGSEV